MKEGAGTVSFFPFAMPGVTRGEKRTVAVVNSPSRESADAEREVIDPDRPFDFRLPDLPQLTSAGVAAADEG